MINEDLDLSDITFDEIGDYGKNSKGSNNIKFQQNSKVAPKNAGPEPGIVTEKRGESMSENLTQKLSEVFDNLSTITGFISAGVYDSRGEILASRSSQDFNFEEVGGLAIELYLAAKSIADKMGIGICNFVEIHTDNYTFIHSCIVPGKGAMGVLLTSSGNIGLTRHQMKKEAQKLVPEFS